MEAGPMVERVEERIMEYLAVGGLFNPELMDHDEVRSIMLDCREAITTLESQLRQAREALERIADIAKRNLGHQTEKLYDIEPLARKTLTALQGSGK
jgi:hypothetical protein